MKNLSLIIAFILLLHNCYAQEVTPYLAIVKTSEGKQKGVLIKVDSNSVVIGAESGSRRIPRKSIQSVKIKEIKAGYQAKRYLKYNWDTSEYNISRGNKMVDQWGNEEPSLANQVSNSVFTEVLNGVVNLIAVPVHAISPAIADFSFKSPPPKEQEESLTYFSIHYQTSPERVLDFKRLNL